MITRPHEFSFVFHSSVGETRTLSIIRSKRIWSAICLQRHNPNICGPPQRPFASFRAGTRFSSETPSYDEVGSILGKGPLEGYDPPTFALQKRCSAN